MKTTLLSIILAGTAVTSVAQPVLTATNMNPVHGEVFYNHYLDTTNVSKGASGAHVIWNFAPVTEIDNDSTEVFACDSTPYCSSFPGSNIAELNAGDYMYMNANSLKLSVIGVYSSGIAVPINNNWEIMHYPLNYTNVYVDTFNVDIPAIDLYRTEIDSYFYDGYGTLILPTGTDTGVVRIKDVSYFTDSTSTDVTHGMTITYNWYKPGFHNPLMTVTYDSVGSDSGQFYVLDANYVTKKASTTGITAVNANRSNLNIYPNPAGESVHIQFATGEAATALITVEDMMGRTVLTIGKYQLTNGLNNIAAPVGDLPSGLYIVRLQSNEGSYSQKFTIAR